MKSIFLIISMATFTLVRSQCSNIAISFTDSVSGNTVYFFDQSAASNGWGIERRYWIYGDSIVDSIVLNPVHVYAQPGVYTVCLAIKGVLPGDSATELRCTDTVCRQVTAFTSGINEMSINDWQIHPNPATSHVVITRGEGILQSVELYDTRGQLLLRKYEPDEVITLPPNSANTAYYIRIQTDRGNIIRQINVVKD